VAQVGELVELIHTPERRALRAIGYVAAVERYVFKGHAWEVVLVRVSLGRFGTLHVYAFAEHIRSAYTLAQEVRKQAEELRDPDSRSTDRVLGFRRTDPELAARFDKSAQERLTEMTGWTRDG